MDKNLKGGSFTEGASYAQKCRTAPPNTLTKAPPPGPKPVPCRLNGVPKIGGNGVK
jgi:hypothetical protein